MKASEIFEWKINLFFTLFLSVVTLQFDLFYIDGTQFEILWVDGYYNCEDPSNPITYHINSANNVQFDFRSIDRIKMSLKLFQILDLDGRSQIFFRLEFSNYLYQFNPAQLGIMHLTEIFLENDHTLYLQTLTYDPPVANRRLSNSQIDTSAKTIEEEQNSFFLFNFLYILSQLGGFFIFWMGLISLATETVFNNMFKKQIVSFLN